jgi:hypothetical protein
MDRAQTNSHPIEETKMATNRFSMIIVLSSIAVLAILSVSMLNVPHFATSTTVADRAELQRAASYRPAAAQQAYLNQREGEWKAGGSVDQSYDAIELLRAQKYAAAASVDTSYDAIELQRAENYQAAAAVDRSYDAVELLRAANYQAAAAQNAYLNYRRGEWTGK